MTYRRDADAIHQRILVRERANSERDARLTVGMETAEEDLRNALQTLVAWRFEAMPVDVNALVRQRIESALRKMGR